MIDIRQNRLVHHIAEEWRDDVKSFFIAPRNTFIMKDKKRWKSFNSYREKLKFQCYLEINQYTKNGRLRIAYKSKLRDWWKHIDDILMASPSEMAHQVEIWKKRKNGSYRLLEALSKVIVSYYDIVAGELGLKLIDRLNIKTCPYCNRQFIYAYKSKKSSERPELDHFYPKNKYPLYCLSFYNLIPACHGCNHVKSEEEIGVNPYTRSFNSKFVLVDKHGKELSKAQIYKLSEEDIILGFKGVDKDENMNIGILGLNDVYNKHTDYVNELIDKSMAYDEHARQALATSFQRVGRPDDVFNFVWGRHLTNAEYEDRPLSKLTKDLLDLLDIKK